MYLAKGKEGKECSIETQVGQCIHYGTALLCLQILLDAASEAANIVGFSFRPDKCASLSLTATRQRATFIETVDFVIQGNDIPALAQEESYRYIEIPIGLVHNIDDLPNIVPQLTKHVEIIGSSLLAPWQKLDALRSFVQPCLTYALRAGNPEMQSLHIYNTDATCRHCAAHPATLPHVVCHCPPHIVQISGRHNSIVQRLTNAIRFGKIATDRTRAESNLRLRPDVVVEEDNRVHIMDVTYMFF